MKEILYNVASTQPCEIGYSGDHKKTKIVFQGFEVQDSTNEVYLKFKGRSAATSYLIPITNLEIVITSTLTAHAGEFSCQLEERKADGTFVSQSGVFKLKIHQSIKANSDYEVTDDRLETIYTQYNALYQDLVAKRDNGFFKGPKGDTGNTGSSGTNGQDGYSPTATVSKVGTTSTITITDKNGTTTASVEDGETQDLTDYVKNTDYATSSKCGVIITNNELNVSSSNGSVYATDLAYNTYSGRGRNIFISKGTLENVLANKTVSDVKINGTSAKVDGVVDIPKATSSNLGVVKADTWNGTQVSNQGTLVVYPSLETHIDNRSNGNKTVIVASNLDYAVKSALCDGRGADYTDTEKANARKRIGDYSVSELPLVADITLAESSSLSITFPTPLSFFRFAFYNSTNGSANSTASMYFKLTNGAKSTFWYGYVSRNGSVAIGDGVVDNRGTVPIFYGSSANTNGENGWGASFQNKILDFNSNLTNYSGLKVVGIYSNDTFVSGTKIKIYGI